MKTICFKFLFLIIVTAGFAQPIPIDSLYLGQIAPDEIRKVSKMQINQGQFEAERIILSNAVDTTLTFSVTYHLPSWLRFNVLTKTFSGLPKLPVELRMVVTAKDMGKARGLSEFKLLVITNS